MCLSPSAPDIPTPPSPPPPPIKMAESVTTAKPAVQRRKGSGAGNPLVVRRPSSGLRMGGSNLYGPINRSG